MVPILTAKVQEYNKRKWAALLVFARLRGRVMFKRFQRKREAASTLQRGWHRISARRKFIRLVEMVVEINRELKAQEEVRRKEAEELAKQEEALRIEQERQAAEQARLDAQAAEELAAKDAVAAAKLRAEQAAAAERLRREQQMERERVSTVAAARVCEQPQSLPEPTRKPKPPTLGLRPPPWQYRIACLHTHPFVPHIITPTSSLLGEPGGASARRALPRGREDGRARSVCADEPKRRSHDRCLHVTHERDRHLAGYHLSRLTTLR